MAFGWFALFVCVSRDSGWIGGDSVEDLLGLKGVKRWEELGAGSEMRVVVTQCLGFGWSVHEF